MRRKPSFQAIRVAKLHPIWVEVWHQTNNVKDTRLGQRCVRPLATLNEETLEGSLCLYPLGLFSGEAISSLSAACAGASQVWINAQQFANILNHLAGIGSIQSKGQFKIAYGNEFSISHAEAYFPGRYGAPILRPGSERDSGAPKHLVGRG
jgi:hypothetical protein